MKKAILIILTLLLNLRVLYAKVITQKVVSQTQVALQMSLSENNKEKNTSQENNRLGEESPREEESWREEEESLREEESWREEEEESTNNDTELESEEDSTTNSNRYYRKNISFKNGVEFEETIQYFSDESCENHTREESNTGQYSINEDENTLILNSRLEIVSTCYDIRANGDSFQLIISEEEKMYDSFFYSGCTSSWSNNDFEDREGTNYNLSSTYLGNLDESSWTGPCERIDDSAGEDNTGSDDMLTGEENPAENDESIEEDTEEYDTGEGDYEDSQSRKKPFFFFRF